MAVQPNQIYPEIPAFEEHPGDRSMEDSQVLYHEFRGSREEVTKFWTEEKAKSDRLEAQIQHPKTHEEYLLIGSAALKRAAETEREHGLEASVEDYEEALTNFLGALGSTPLHDGQLTDPDPVLLIQFAGIQDRLATSEHLRPYTDSPVNRRQNLQWLAIKNLQRAGQIMFDETSTVDDTTTPPAEVVALAAVVTRAVFNHRGMFNEAEDTWTSMRAIVVDEGEAPGVVEFMDSHARSERIPDYLPQRIATGALQELATRTHAELALAK